MLREIPPLTPWCQWNAVRTKINPLYYSNLTLNVPTYYLQHILRFHWRSWVLEAGCWKCWKRSSLVVWHSIVFLCIFVVYNSFREYSNMLGKVVASLWVSDLIYKSFRLIWIKKSFRYPKALESWYLLLVFRQVICLISPLPDVFGSLVYKKCLELFILWKNLSPF